MHPNILKRLDTNNNNNNNNKIENKNSNINNKITLSWIKTTAKI